MAERWLIAECVGSEWRCYLVSLLVQLLRFRLVSILVIVNGDRTSCDRIFVRIINVAKCIEFS